MTTDHYAEAERLAAKAQDPYGADSNEPQWLLALAQVHATLPPTTHLKAADWLAWERNQVDDPAEGIERAVLAWRPVLPWTAEEAPRG